MEDNKTSHSACITLLHHLLNEWDCSGAIFSFHPLCQFTIRWVPYMLGSMCTRIMYEFLTRVHVDRLPFSIIIIPIARCCCCCCCCRWLCASYKERHSEWQQCHWLVHAIFIWTLCEALGSLNRYAVCVCLCVNARVNLITLKLYCNVCMLLQGEGDIFFFSTQGMHPSPILPRNGRETLLGSFSLR